MNYESDRVLDEVVVAYCKVSHQFQRQENSVSETRYALPDWAFSFFFFFFWISLLHRVQARYGTGPPPGGCRPFQGKRNLRSSVTSNASFDGSTFLTDFPARPATFSMLCVANVTPLVTDWKRLWVLLIQERPTEFFHLFNDTSLSA
jgi:hypothetical protein